MKASTIRKIQIALTAIGSGPAASSLVWFYEQAKKREQRYIDVVLRINSN